MAVLIGTSGWHYGHWKGGFYPPRLEPSLWLAHYAGSFATVEVNNAFYRLPDAGTFAKWAEGVPADFTFAVKASRYLTHVRRLQAPQEPVRLLLDRARHLGAKLGAVLLQLPPTLRADVDALAAALDAFPAHVRVAVEPRHPSWFSDETRALLERMGAALCLTDVDGKGPPHWRTADWGYVRFHHGRASPPSCYGRTALRSWAEELARLWPPSADIYVYFNNDQNGCAPNDARRFATAVARAGLVPTRAPRASETPLSSGSAADL